MVLIMVWPYVTLGHFGGVTEYRVQLFRKWRRRRRRKAAMAAMAEEGSGSGIVREAASGEVRGDGGGRERDGGFACASGGLKSGARAADARARGARCAEVRVYGLEKE